MFVKILLLFSAIGIVYGITIPGDAEKLSGKEFSKKFNELTKLMTEVRTKTKLHYKLSGLENAYIQRSSGISYYEGSFETPNDEETPCIVSVNKKLVVFDCEFEKIPIVSINLA